MNINVVVGDVFRPFAQQSGVIVYSDLLKALENGDRGIITDSTFFVPGQGLSQEQAQHIEEIAAQRGVKSAFIVWHDMTQIDRAGRAHIHKHRSENSLLSVPRQERQNTFVSELLIDGRNEFLGDHQTGQHVQGMVLMEACRQMFLAVTEEFFLPEAWRDRAYFVINAMDVRFKSFAFPVEGNVYYRLIEKDMSREDRASFSADIEVVQGGISATMNVSYAVFDEDVLKPKETRHAERTLESLREQARGRIQAMMRSRAPELPVGALLQSA